MKNKCVYMHLIPNGKVFYVGMGSISRAYNKRSRNKEWHKIVEKYGFEVLILQKDMSSEDAAKSEIFWISLIGKENLVNKSSGGEYSAQGMKHSEETKRKISKNSASRRPDVIEKHRENAKGSKNPMFGKLHSDEAKALMSEKRRLRKTSYITRLRMSAARMGNKNHQYDHTIRTFIKDDITLRVTSYEFRTITNFDSSAVSQIVTGVRKTYKGWSVIK